MTGGDIARQALVHVDRAAGELRRDCPVVVSGGGRGASGGAAETATPATLDRLRALSGQDPVLAITANRASVLHVNPTGEDVLLIRIGAHMREEGPRSSGGPRRRSRQSAQRAIPQSRSNADCRTPCGDALAKVARLLPAAVTARLEVRNAQGWAREHDFSMWRRTRCSPTTGQPDCALTRVAAARVPLAGAENARVFAFRPEAGGIEHLAIVIGDPSRHEPVLARIHSECFTGDLLGSLEWTAGSSFEGPSPKSTRPGAGCSCIWPRKAAASG